MVGIVVAYGRNQEIGKNGQLPWGRDLPADLAHFKRLTMGGNVIMGRKTFESIGKKPLLDRENIVISSRPTGVARVLTAVDLDSALALARYKTFIIGGAQVYAEALNNPEVIKIYATEIDAEFPGSDTFFPEFDKSDWIEVSREHHTSDENNKYSFDFVEYTRL